MKTLRSIFFLSLCLLLSIAGYAGDKASFLKKQFTARDGYQLNYRVLYPRDYNPAQKYPVILFLHGAGERGSDNEAQLVHGGDMFASFENQTKYPAIIIAPQCPAERLWSEYKGLNAGKEGKRFYPLNAPATQSMAAVKELLDSYIAEGKARYETHLRNRPIDGRYGHVRYRDALPEPVCRCHPDLWWSEFATFGKL